MDTMEYIESYFKGINSNAQTQQFEKRIIDDPLFAEAVAFYISANGLVEQQVQNEKKQRFREIYDERKVISIKQPVKYIWRYMAAASVVAAVILLTWFRTGDNRSSQELADKYIQQNFQTLSVTMGNQDSLQIGLNLFNSGQYSESLQVFETLLKNDPANSNVKKYAGIASLRMENYNKALVFFTDLEANTSLYSNPGKFYKAITLLKRNKNADKQEAKALLETVIEKNLEGRNQAVQWIKDL